MNVTRVDQSVDPPPFEFMLTISRADFDRLQLEWSKLSHVYGGEASTEVPTVTRLVFALRDA